MNDRGQVRAAIVGAGLMGRWHARAASKAGGVVVAVIDADSVRAARLAATHDARAASTLTDAVSHGAIDVVHVCTPLDTHVAVAREAVTLGLHALVEKPLAPTSAETEDLLRHAATHGRLICPVHQFPFQHGVRRILQALPRLAPVRHVEVIACSAGADSGDADMRDRVAADILPHPLSLFGAMLDVPIANASWQARRVAPGELLATGEAGGATLSLLISMSGRPTTNALRLTGAGGTAHADLFHGFAVIESAGVSRTRKILHPFALAGATLAQSAANLARRAMTRESAYPGLRELVAEFYSAVAGTAPPPISAARALDIAQARDTVCLALRT